MTLELSEADWQAQVVALAKLYRWHVHHDRPALNQRGQWFTPIQGDPGFPDLVLARGGRVLFVELKTDRGRLTGHQQAWHEQLRGAAVEFYLWRPQDWPIVQVALAPGVVGPLAHTEDDIDTARTATDQDTINPRGRL